MQTHVKQGVLSDKGQNAHLRQLHEHQRKGDACAHGGSDGTKKILAVLIAVQAEAAVEIPKQHADGKQRGNKGDILHRRHLFQLFTVCAIQSHQQIPQQDHGDHIFQIISVDRRMIRSHILLGQKNKHHTGPGSEI